MALSANQQNPRPMSNSGQTWAQVARNSTTHRPTRVSLLNTPPTSPNSDTTQTLTNVIRTKLFRNGRNDGSFFLDVSSRPETESTLFQMILKLYPACRGAAPFRDGGRRFLEVNLNPNAKEAITKFTSSGLLFDDKKQILPSPALPDRANLKRLTLSRMPFLSKQEILQGLNTTLKMYGSVIDIGIITDPTSGMYLGSGYAVIDTTTPSGDMKNFCKYCHKDGHVRDNCPIAPPLRLCYACNRPGHIAAHCPSISQHHDSSSPPPRSPMDDSTDSITTSDNSDRIQSPNTPHETNQTTTNDESTTSPPSQAPSQNNTPSTAIDEEDFTEINQAAFPTTAPTGNSNTDSSTNSAGTSQSSNELSLNDASDFTLFPDNQQPPSNTQQQSPHTTTPNLFSDERSFLQEHNTSSSTKKARITTESLHDRLDRLTSSSNSSDSQSTTNVRRSARLDSKPPINYCQ
ncbi:hypothetical protein BCR42DRAFT_444367 [Absidia repens]|uniref:CCHC-type domain-containing protein n=1 Tax=Absidia repens TaxID=90262 RepID=A0A1X2HRB1_9FUNG|nr:hypothetical protein BCR42DRAFT_444367 [Absidia repens]